MFSPRRRALSRRAQKRLVIFGILSIASWLAITIAPNLTATWPEPIRPAFAQSDTATPTVVPQPQDPPKPTSGLGEPPLTLQSSASVASAIAGEQFSFSTTIAAASVEPRAVEVRMTIDNRLELLSASGGSCSGGTALSCKLNVHHGQSATIVAKVRVRPNTIGTSQLVYQALAQDDLSNTAASDQVIVTIATPPAPTTPPDSAPSPPPQIIPANGASPPAHPTIPASRTARPTATAVPADATVPVMQSTAAPTALTLPTVPAAILRSSAAAAVVTIQASEAAPADSWLILAPGVPAPGPAFDTGASAPVSPEQEVTVPEPALPADISASAPVAPVALEQRQVVQLPNTAAAPPIAGLVVVLVGLALTFHGLRRVRRAAAQLDRQSAALGRLAKLMHAEARRRAGMADQPFKSREQ